jgi:hypothetical protein
MILFIFEESRQSEDSSSSSKANLKSVHIRNEDRKYTFFISIQSNVMHHLGICLKENQVGIYQIDNFEYELISYRISTLDSRLCVLRLAMVFRLMTV